MMLHTTYNLAMAHRPCGETVKKMTRALGGVRKYGKDTPVALTQVLDTLGLEEAFWSLRCVLPEGEAARDRLARLFAADCAEHVLPIFERTFPHDTRPRRAIAVSRRYALGQTTLEELAAAWAAAGDAAWAAWAAGNAAGDAARDAWAAWAAGNAARNAARDTAGDAARDAWAAAGDAEREWQAKRLREYLEGEA